MSFILEVEPRSRTRCKCLPEEQPVSLWGRRISAVWRGLHASMILLLTIFKSHYSVHMTTYNMSLQPAGLSSLRPEWRYERISGVGTWAKGSAPDARISHAQTPNDLKHCLDMFSALPQWATHHNFLKIFDLANCYIRIIRRFAYGVSGMCSLVKESRTLWKCPLDGQSSARGRPLTNIPTKCQRLRQTPHGRGLQGMST